MDIDLLMSRREVEAEMKDRCIIAGDEVKVWDEESARNITTRPTVYKGRCRVKSEYVKSADVTAQGQQVIVQRLRLDLPVEASVQVRPNHVATITTSGNDPAQVGRVFRITGPHTQTTATTRRFPVTETL